MQPPSVHTSCNAAAHSILWQLVQGVAPLMSKAGQSCWCQVGMCLELLSCSGSHAGARYASAGVLSVWSALCKHSRRTGSSMPSLRAGA